MKRHWTTYLLSICALLICSCTQREVLIEGPTHGSREVPISFCGSYVDHATTRHPSALRDHLTSMGVWGWCNGMWDDNVQIFADQAVTYNPDSTRWEYNPLQYWHNQCHYTFYAYAPHQQVTDSQVHIDVESHMISIDHVTLHGCNLQDTPSDSAKELFAHTTDTDWMVARAGQTAVGAAGMDVEFMMQHILGKLNIRIQACPDMLARPHIKGVTVDSIIVGTFPSHGDFVQQLTHTPIISDPAEADTEEWTAYDTDLTIRGTHSRELTAAPTYIVESLVIPHHVGENSNVELFYSYHFRDGHTEQCRYLMPLIDAFSRFVSGYNHTLTFTVCSSRIIFEAGAHDWEEKHEVKG